MISRCTAASHGELSVRSGGAPTSHDETVDATSSEEPVVGVVHAPERVVVDDGAGDAAVGGQHACLRLDLLCREDAPDRSQQGIAVEQLEVAGELLDAVDLAAALDLDRDGGAPGITAHQVDRPDRRGELAPDQGEPVAEVRG